MRSVITVILILLFFPGCRDAAKNQPVQSLPDLSVQDVNLYRLSGEKLDWKDYKDKTVFINFWATWCKPCVQEMQSLQRLAEKLRDKNIVFLFASDESSEKISDFKTSHGYSMEFVRMESLTELNIMALPVTFIFNKNGKIVFSEMGAKGWDSDQSIDSILKIINDQ